MKRLNSLLAVTILVCALTGTVATPTLAALPCNLYDAVDIEFQAGSGEPVPSPPRPLEEILTSDEPADRDGAMELTYNDGALRANVVGAGENVLRCLDYGQDRVLIDNATSDLYSSRFEPADIAIGKELVEHGADGGVTMVVVDNPLRLADGRFLVDFTFKHDDKWHVGEMVFVRNGNNFRLDSTYLTKVEPAKSLLTVTVDEQGFPDDQISVSANTDIQVMNETDEPFSLVVVSGDDDSEVVRSRINSANMEGPRSAFILPTSEWSPGEYVASIETADRSQYVVVIIVEP